MPRKYSKKKFKGGANTHIHTIPECPSVQEYPFYKTPCASLPLDAAFSGKMSGGGYSFDVSNTIADQPAVVNYPDCCPPYSKDINTIQSTLQLGGKRNYKKLSKKRNKASVSKKSFKSAGINFSVKKAKKSRSKRVRSKKMTQKKYKIGGDSNILPNVKHDNSWYVGTNVESYYMSLSPKERQRRISYNIKH